MRNPSTSVGLACLVAAYGLATAPAASAATGSGTTYATGSICQLSIPTTDTKFRLKATGGRNESTSVSNFVICPVIAPVVNGNQLSSFFAVFTYVYSIDGADHDVSCTAVTGYNGGSMLYSTKTARIGSLEGAIGHPFFWNASDFGGVNNAPIANGALFSVTCLLAPQTAVNIVVGAYNYDVGN